jgi:heme/copper-type cytochrome/quinol oxidase subunit 4
MSFLDSSHPRSVLWLFYSSAFLSAIMFSAASYASVSYHRPLLVLALVTALAAAFFLVLFLRSRDERERQINYRALTFAFSSVRSSSRSLSAWHSSLDFIPCPGSGFLQ